MRRKKNPVEISKEGYFGPHNEIKNSSFYEYNGAKKLTFEIELW